MRLFEIAPPRTEGPEPVLMAILSYLKGKGDQRATGIRVPMTSVLALMQNAGQPITYYELESLKNKNQTLQGLIKDMDQSSITLNTHTVDSEEGEEADAQFQPGDQKDVEHMAQRAAKRSEEI